MLRSLSGVMILLAAIGILSIGVFGLLDPGAGALAFGIPVLDPRDRQLLSIAAIRDVVLGVLLLALLRLRDRRTLTYAIGILAAIPVLDGALVLVAGGGTFRPVVLIHWSSGGFMLAIVALLRNGK